MTMTDFLQNAYAYLKGKLPDVPEHTSQEIAAHLTNMANIALMDEVYKVRDQMVNDFRHYENKKYRQMKQRGGARRAE